MSKQIPSTYNTFIPGVGITITRANIRDEQIRRAEAGRSPATPEEIVMSFVTKVEAETKGFHQSPRYAKLVARASQIMNNKRK